MKKGQFDLGVVSFGTVIATSSYLLALANTGTVGSVSRLTTVIATASHLLVAANYTIGMYVGITLLKRTGFTIYCAVFTLLWVGVAIVGRKLLVSGDGTWEPIPSSSEL